MTTDERAEMRRVAADILDAEAKDMAWMVASVRARRCEVPPQFRHLTLEQLFGLPARLRNIAKGNRYRAAILLGAFDA